MASDPLKDKADPESRSTEVIESRVSAPQTLQPGQRLKGRYLIDRELGRGGIGVVYLARDERLHSMPVVIKFLLDDSGKSSWLTRKFRQEAEALTRINHPGVVRVIDRDTTDDGRPFFVMEFVIGQPLRAAMTSTGVNLEYAAQLIRQIGTALHAAHQQGVIHRDLKPENVLLQSLTGGEEQTKLIDFGIAKVHDSQSGTDTEVAVIAGSLQYMAPEQLSSQPVSAATDLYALGIIAYELLTGRRPFNPDAPGYLAAAQQLAGMQQTESIVPPRSLRPSLPADAEALILSALKFDPRLRPQDARVFVDDLARALKSGETGQSAFSSQSTDVLSAARSAPAPPPQSAAIVSEGRSKARIRIGLVGGAIAIVLLGIAGIFWLMTSRQDVTPQGTATAPVTAAARTFSYSLTVQKDPVRYPGSKPFQLPGEVIFSPGDRIRLSVNTPQPGFLYIINESPDSSQNLLFPSSTSNAGSAELAAGQSIQIPERGDGFVFDEQQGTEKLWLIWSAASVPQLEAVKRWANPEDRGQIKDIAEQNAIRELLGRTPEANAEKDEAQRQTNVRGSTDILIKLVKLEHH